MRIILWYSRTGRGKFDYGICWTVSIPHLQSHPKHKYIPCNITAVHPQYQNNTFKAASEQKQSNDLRTDGTNLKKAGKKDILMCGVKYHLRNSARISACWSNSAFKGNKISVDKFGSVDKIDQNDPRRNNILKPLTQAWRTFLMARVQIV